MGYGTTEFGGQPLLKLHEAPIHKISHEKCHSKLGQYMAPERNTSMFCAEGYGLKGQVDACQVTKKKKEVNNKRKIIFNTFCVG